MRYCIPAEHDPARARQDALQTRYVGCVIAFANSRPCEYEGRTTIREHEFKLVPLVPGIEADPDRTDRRCGEENYEKVGMRCRKGRDPVPGTNPSGEQRAT